MTMMMMMMLGCSTPCCAVPAIILHTDFGLVHVATNLNSGCSQMHKGHFKDARQERGSAMVATKIS